ncbi:MAG: hypothetical protein KJO07_22065 [Deltaproteobacteria bacterium]|nr:hypothetical protein [Deltaproteobacteria bacterium]
MGLLCLLIAAGCNEREVSTVEPAPAVQTGHVVESTRPNLDLLFVIDNSGSMKEEQESLAANFPGFIDIIDAANPQTGRPNLHIGVISPDLGGPAGVDSRCSGNGDGGSLLAVPRVRTDCTGPDGLYFIDRADSEGNRITNYQGSLDDAFSCVAELGTDGCGFEQPLEAVRRAIDNPVNEGFFRKDSLLAIIFITDEDDCSMTDAGLMEPAECSEPFDSGSCPLGPLSSFRCFEFGVECDQGNLRSPGVKSDCKPTDDSPYMQRLDAVAGAVRAIKDPERVFVAAIAGTLGDALVELGGPAKDSPTLAPACSSDAGVAASPYRLASFLGLFPNQDLRSICDADLGPALGGIATEIGLRLGDECVPGSIELSPEQPGIEVDCSVLDVTFDGESESETLLPRCDAPQVPASSGNLPCWNPEIEPECQSHTDIAIRIYRPDSDEPPSSRRTDARCVDRLQ